MGSPAPYEETPTKVPSWLLMGCFYWMKRFLFQELFETQAPGGCI